MTFHKLYQKTDPRIGSVIERLENLAIIVRFETDHDMAKVILKGPNFSPTQLSLIKHFNFIQG